ncbi:MAG TPA: VOC family protein [Acidisarcina sp.]|nr:VOC family protein [Acidisarcina sp.]
MELNPYLSFNGQCEAAFKFYEQSLGGKIEVMMKYADSPMAKDTPADQLNQIIHARLTVGEQVLMGSDVPPERYSATHGISLSLSFTDPAESEKVFNALVRKGTVQMPLQETFWAVRFGMLVDQFGIPWMINCEKRA